MPQIIKVDLDPKKIAADKRKIKKAMMKNISPTYFIKDLTKKAIDGAKFFDDAGNPNQSLNKSIISHDRTVSLNQKSHIRDTFGDGKVKQEIWIVRTDFLPALPDNYNDKLRTSCKLPVPTPDYAVETLNINGLYLYLKPVSIEYSKTYDIMACKYRYQLGIHYQHILQYKDVVSVIPVGSSSAIFGTGNFLHCRAMGAASRAGVDLKNLATEYQEYLKRYSLNDWLIYQAFVWQNELDQHLAHIWNDLADEDVNLVLRYIGNKAVDLDNYNHIHTDLQATKRWTDIALEKLCQDNINIQMVHILNSMKNDINLYPVTPSAPKDYVATSVDGQSLSKEQAAAVCSTEPLLLITAGAGTGKTQVITARAKFLIDVGIKPEDILILSFTRTAASTVESRLPGIKSLTINAFVDSIYSKNYPEQAIDDTMTFINTLTVLRKDAVNDMKRSEFYKEFGKIMEAVYDNLHDAYAKLQSFVTEHFDEVMETCKRIGRTTFDIQMVTACVNIYNMEEPEEIKAKYMFIDEVQDNSIFDFIFAIKYCEKHHIALTIVGDASQTLFEFRGADTKAIGVIERSDVFSKERLSINYRSNNEILSMANMQLNWIEANKMSNIQLISDKFSKPTQQSFSDTVKLSYDNVAQGGDKAWRELIWDKDTCSSVWLEGAVKDYIQECLNRKEKVAILAFQRRPLEAAQKALAMAFPNNKITNLTPPAPYACNILSHYAAHCDIQGAPYNNVLTTLRASIERSSATMREAMAKKKNGEYSPTANVFDIVWNKFVLTYASQVDIWVNDVKNGIIDDDQFVTNIRDALLNTETEYNAELNKSKLSNDPNKERAEAKANADILLSTIHSAKGDEFDNCVVMYHDESAMSEENKRMYYVAFTRAQKTLFISAYGSDVHPLIEAQYQETARNL